MSTPSGDGPWYVLEFQGRVIALRSVPMASGFRPLNADGDAAARRPYHCKTYHQPAMGKGVPFRREQMERHAEPGVFFLFVERFQRLKPKSTSTDKLAD